MSKTGCSGDGRKRRSGLVVAALSQRRPLMSNRGIASLIVALALAAPSAVLADHGDDGRTDPALLKARQFFFGAENVNAKGEVDKDKVIFSWLTNTDRKSVV